MQYLVAACEIFQLWSAGGSVVKNLPTNVGGDSMQVRSLGQEDPLEKERATHSSVLAWEISWTEEPGMM